MGEGLPLLAKNSHNIGCGTSAKRNQHKLHRRVRGFFGSSVHHNRMMRRGFAEVAFVVGPDCFCCNHRADYLRLSVLGSGCIRTRNSSGASCLKRISSSVWMSCTRASESSSDSVQWQEMYRRPRTRLMTKS